MRIYRFHPNNTPDTSMPAKADDWASLNVLFICMYAYVCIHIYTHTLHMYIYIHTHIYIYIYTADFTQITHPKQASLQKLMTGRL